MCQGHLYLSAGEEMATIMIQTLIPTVILMGLTALSRTQSWMLRVTSTSP